jgi:hypothetical protein
LQPLRQLAHALRLLADRDHCVFAASDLAAAVPACGALRDMKATRRSLELVNEEAARELV